MAAMTDQQVRDIRAEVGSSPSDDDLQELWDVLGNVPAVALAVLRPRMADALTAAAQGSATIPGAITVGAPAQPTLLAAQIARLEAQLVALTGDPDTTGLTGSTGFLRRTDRVR